MIAGSFRLQRKEGGMADPPIAGNNDPFRDLERERSENCCSREAYGPGRRRRDRSR